MLVLLENQSCPHSSNCPYNKDSNCAGAFPRDTKFTCSYVNSNGQITESGEVRNNFDKTGQMKYLSEDH